MRGLSAEQILDVWERGQELPPVARALAILGAATGVSTDELARLSVGERDALLFALRRSTFGDTLEGAATCPACTARLELSLSLAELCAQLGEGEELGELTHGALRVRFRRLDSHDLDEAAHDEDGRALALRCVVEAHLDDQLIDAVDLPEEVFALLDERVAVADPFAEILLALSCEACGHAWQENLDIAGFFHAELAWAAGRLLDQVHLLARSYGWNEAEVLALGPRRRQAYLERVLG